jgi:DNA-binding response OmpR family regulator
LYLENGGYRVLEAGDGGQALETLASEDVSLCLLDIMMPGIDGYQVLRQLRQSSHIPVIVISAKGQDPEKILGLNLGADDYLVKPFNPLEAVARVGALLRRLSYDRQAPAAPTPDEPVATSAQPPLVVRDLRLDREACTLERGGQLVTLTSVEYRIMELLMEHPGRVFTKAQIYEAGWGEEYLAAENNVMVSISKLRSKLDSDPQAYIATIRGVGYRLKREG